MLNCFKLIMKMLEKNGYAMKSKLVTYKSRETVHSCDGQFVYCLYYNANPKQEHTNLPW